MILIRPKSYLAFFHSVFTERVAKRKLLWYEHATKRGERWPKRIFWWSPCGKRNAKKKLDEGRGLGLDDWIDRERWREVFNEIRKTRGIPGETSNKYVSKYMWHIEWNDNLTQNTDNQLLGHPLSRGRLLFP